MSWRQSNLNVTRTSMAGSRKPKAWVDPRKCCLNRKHPAEGHRVSEEVRPLIQAYSLC